MHKNLEEILSKTREDLLIKKRSNNSFSHAMKNTRKGLVSIIAEVKLASPTEKKLGTEEDIINRVKEYKEGGADAISIVTEKHFFKGDPKFVKQIKEVVGLPVLQKDFCLDEYQIYEQKLAGADAILFITRILSENDLVNFVKLSQEIGLESVVEINTKDDLKKALATNTEIIAVNARDLDTFEVNVDKACEILQSIPSKFIKLGFSGIHSKVEVEKYRQAGVKGILIGTSLMKAHDVKVFLEGIRV